MEIYLDVLIVLNTYLSWLLMNLTAFLTSTRLRPWRCAAGSFVGGISSLIILLPDSVKLYGFTAVLLKMISCGLSAFIAFYGVSAKKLLILTVSLFGSGALLSGVLYFLENILNMPKIALSSGFIYIRISPVMLVAVTAGVYILAMLFSKLYGRFLGSSNSYRVEFRIGCKAFSLDGTADTGNTAKDLFSGLPVIICTGTEITSGRKFRAIPYKTVAGEGILYAYAPDEITVTEYGKKPQKVSALVASASSDGEKKAIFNPRILS